MNARGKLGGHKGPSIRVALDTAKYSFSFSCMFSYKCLLSFLRNVTQF